LVRANVPYRLVGATRFYERREIKDVLAYLRLVHNPFDNISLSRVINVPPRGLGQRTVGDLERWAEGQGIPIYTALQLVESKVRKRENAEQVRPTTNEHARHDDVLPSPASAGPYPFTARAEQTLAGFLRLLNDLLALREQDTVAGLINRVLDKTGYGAYIQDGTEEGRERWQNVQELVNVGAQFDEEVGEGGLAAFLETVSLVSDVDNYEEKVDAVTLLTLHSAKGLEFPVVFIVGMEEGLLPHANTLDDPEELEEERRLCYVGITRAMKRLYLVRAFRRTVFGNSQPRDPSRFLADIPPQLVVGRQAFGGRQIPLALGGKAVGGPATSQAQIPQPPGIAESAAPQQPPHTFFKAGERVRHPLFGEGIVVSAVAESNDVFLTVAFQGNVGLKKLSLAFAPLERVTE